MKFQNFKILFCSIDKCKYNSVCVQNCSRIVPNLISYIVFSLYYYYY